MGESDLVILVAMRQRKPRVVGRHIRLRRGRKMRPGIRRNPSRASDDTLDLGALALNGIRIRGAAFAFELPEDPPDAPTRSFEMPCEAAFAPDQR